MSTTSNAKAGTAGTDPLAKFRRRVSPAATTLLPGATEAGRSSIDPVAGNPLAAGADDKQPYEAYRLSKDERRYLEIRLKFPEPAEAQSNAMLVNVRGEWRMGMAITLEYGNNTVVLIRGERLAELFRALQAWKVEFIAEFDSEEHHKPESADAPFIESITIHTTRPEAPPPASALH